MTTTHEPHPLLNDAVATGQGVVAYFQPIVELAEGVTVAFEALARWPHLDAGPSLVFDLAAHRRTVHELDRACHRAALRDATKAGVPADVPLFVNVEATRLTEDVRPGADGTPIETTDRAVVLELTERHLLDSPAELLSSVQHVRDLGYSIALDDVGAHQDSLALQDLIRPEVVKLDLALVQATPKRDQVRTLAAIMAHVERTGGVVLAEGIESDADRERALACGAVLGQGWHYGVPARSLSTDLIARRSDLHPNNQDHATPSTPFDLTQRIGPTRVAEKPWLTKFSRHIETQAANLADPPVVLAAMQRYDQYTASTRDKYSMLAERSPLVAIFGTDMPSAMPGRVRPVQLDREDPLTLEWTVVALGAQTAVALIARDLGDDAEDRHRRFEFAITYDRAVVTDAARSMLARLHG